LGFLPAKFAYSLAEACVEAGRSLVDVSYMSESPLRLSNAASRAGSTIVPDCGLAPGISNVLVGHSASMLDKVEMIHVMVGGLPEKPIPPLDYVITWSPESLIDEYTRRARIVCEGRKAEVEALSGVEEVDFPSVGKLEAFYTDGLRTLLDTFNGVTEMWEKTLRYPGHAEKVRLLRSLGLFSDAEVSIEGTSIQPRKLTAKIFEQNLARRKHKDIVVLRTETRGVKNGEKTTYLYELLDTYDREQNVTAMARTTAYPASIVAQMILKRTMSEKGVVPPERIGMDSKLFEFFSEGLKSRGITTNEKVLT